MYTIQQEWQIGGVPTEWNELPGRYPTLRAAFSAMESCGRDPGGYGRRHRVIDAAGKDVTSAAYAAAGRDCEFEAS